MAGWREVFGFDGEDVDFGMVHMRYRAKMLEPVTDNDLEYITRLNAALEEARRELATQRSRG